MQATQCPSALSYRVTLIFLTLPCTLRSNLRRGNSSGVSRGGAPTRAPGPLCPSALGRPAVSHDHASPPATGQLPSDHGHGSQVAAAALIGLASPVVGGSLYQSVVTTSVSVVFTTTTPTLTTSVVAGSIPCSGVATSGYPAAASSAGGSLYSPVVSSGLSGLATVPGAGYHSPVPFVAVAASGAGVVSSGESAPTVSAVSHAFPPVENPSSGLFQLGGVRVRCRVHSLLGGQVGQPVPPGFMPPNVSVAYPVSCGVSGGSYHGFAMPNLLGQGASSAGLAPPGFPPGPPAAAAARATLGSPFGGPSGAGVSSPSAHHGFMMGQPAGSFPATFAAAPPYLGGTAASSAGMPVHPGYAGQPSAQPPFNPFGQVAPQMYMPYSPYAGQHMGFGGMYAPYTGLPVQSTNCFGTPYGAYPAGPVGQQGSVPGVAMGAAPLVSNVVPSAVGAGVYPPAPRSPACVSSSCCRCLSFADRSVGLLYVGG